MGSITADLASKELRARNYATHVTRMSDSSHYDERCVLCEGTDGPGDTTLDHPCVTGRVHHETHNRAFEYRPLEYNRYRVFCKDCGADDFDSLKLECTGSIPKPAELVGERAGETVVPVRHTPRGWSDKVAFDIPDHVSVTCANWRSARHPLNIDDDDPKTYSGYVNNACRRIVKETLTALTAEREFEGHELLNAVKTALAFNDGHIHFQSSHRPEIGVPFSETQIVQTIDTWVSRRSQPKLTSTIEIVKSDLDETIEAIFNTKITATEPCEAKMVDVAITVETSSENKIMTHPLTDFVKNMLTTRKSIDRYDLAVALGAPSQAETWGAYLQVATDILVTVTNEGNLTASITGPGEMSFHIPAPRPYKENPNG